MRRALTDWWNRLVDRWVRLESRRLDDAVLARRKLLHTAQIVAVWPLLRLERSWLALVLAAACLFVLLTQRRLPYASLALLTLLAFAGRLAFGGAWVVFTAGDGAAALVGRPVGGPRLPWNGKKTWAGSGAFVLAAGVALLVLLRWQERDLSWAASLLIAIGVAGFGAVVESLNVPLDDNYSVIVAAGALLELLLRLVRVDGY